MSELHDRTADVFEQLAAFGQTLEASAAEPISPDPDLSLSHVWFTDDGVTVVELEAPVRPQPRRKIPLRVLVAGLVAAAVVVAITLLVARDANHAVPADQPGTSTTSPRPLPSTPGVQRLTPGTYYVDEVSGTPTPRIFATIGAGWWNPPMDQGWQLFKADTRFGKPGLDDLNPNQIGFMTYSNPVAVHSDACHWEDGYHPGPVDTLDGLVDALTGQQGWAEITVPSDISVDGYVGKAFQRTAPGDMSDCNTRIYRSRTSDDGLQPRPDFQSWENADGEFDGVAEPGQVQTLWVLDIDGTLIVITTGVFPEASASARPDFADDVLDSIRIARPLPNLGGEAFEPGTYYVDEVSGTPTPRIFATLDSGWFDLDAGLGWAHIARGRWPGVVGHVAISHPVAVFSDACHPTDSHYPGSVATVDGFVAALREQRGGWVDVTAPSDISVDGYRGKTFQRTAPAVMSDCTSWDGSSRSPNTAAFPSWESAEGINDGYAPGTVETLWVLDLDGTVIVISTELWPDPSATAHADFAHAVLASIRIDRP